MGWVHNIRTWFNEWVDLHPDPRNIEPNASIHLLSNDKSKLDYFPPMRMSMAVLASKNDWIAYQTTGVHGLLSQNFYRTKEFQLISRTQSNLMPNGFAIYLNLNVLLTTFGVFVFLRPRRLPFVSLLVGVPLRLRDVVSVLLVLVKLIISS